MTPTTALPAPSAYAAALMNTFGEPLRVLDRGEGAWVWDVEGVRYLDFLGGIAVNALGHAHPVFVDAITRQAGRLAHISNFFSSVPQIRLAERLQRITGFGTDGRVFFTNSGTEASEAAFKLARRHGAGGARPRIIALENSFHGRSMGALALTGKPAAQAPFAPMPPGVEHIPATLDALAGAMDDRVAAIVVEPIQGEAGVVPLPHGFLELARRLASEHGSLLIVDEIQTGVGRTGRWFGYQHEDVLPDAITMAKGMGGGFPIGALVARGDAAALLGPGQHGSTFGGNPLATAVADAVLAHIEEADLVGAASERGAQIRSAIDRLAIPELVEVRGAGLLLGIAVRGLAAADLARAALDAGLIVNAPNPETLRLAPPLIIDSTHVDEFAERLGIAVDAVRRTTPEGTT